MKKTVSRLLAGCCLVAAVTAVATSKTSITIDDIEADVRIRGRVEKLSAQDAQSVKVLVYVLTDQWYIHPFADGGEGKSFAKVSPDGSWQIGTVKRDYPAKKIAAVLVPGAYAEPARLATLDPLPARAIVVRSLTGTDDYGKL